MNNTKFIILLVSAVLVIDGLSCSHRHDSRASAPDSQAGLNDTQPGSPGSPGRRGARGGLGAGQGIGRGRGRAWESSEPLRLSQRELEAVSLETAAVSFRPMATDLRATGKIFAHQLRQAIVSYPFPARIARIHVRPGEWVKAGQELVTLQSEAVGEAKSEYFKALADAELAKNNFERERRLFDRGAGAGKNLQAAEAELKVAQASLNAAEKKLHILGFTEAQIHTAEEIHEVNPLITLFAPISGKVLNNTAVLGGMIDQTSEILTLLDPSLVCADADIYERDVAKIRIGQEVEVTVPAHPDLVFGGTLKYVGDILNEETRTITVRTEVENRNGKLKPGMFASLRIILDRQSRVLTIAEAAVLDDGDRKICFVKRDGAFLPREVVTGAKVDGYFEVLGGVEEGEEVVTVGSYQLKSRLYDEILKAAGIH